MRTWGHSRTLALWAVEMVTWAPSSGVSWATAARIASVPCSSMSGARSRPEGSFGVVLQLAPGAEEDQSGVGGALPAFEIAGVQGEGLGGSSPTGKGDAVAGREVVDNFDHDADVGAAQDGRGGLRRGAEGGGDVGGAGQADGGLGEGEPTVGPVGHSVAEAERSGQAEVDSVEAPHDVAGTAPAVDGLG